MRMLTILWFSYVSILWGQQAGILLEVKPPSITPGDAATLTWQVRGAEQVYLSNVGKVQVTGQIKVRPEHSTTYTLIAESKTGLSSQTVALEVKGTRGGSDFPATTEFQFKNNYQVACPSFVALLDQIHHLLQDILEFQVDESYDRHAGQTKFLTKLSTKSELVQPNEKTIRARRIAYLIEIHEFSAAAKEYPCTIQVLIQYQRRSERSWRREGMETIYQQQSQKLYALIRQAFD